MKSERTTLLEPDVLEDKSYAPGGGNHLVVDIPARRRNVGELSGGNRSAGQAATSIGKFSVFATTPCRGLSLAPQTCSFTAMSLVPQ